jgi:hypothetical protein
MPKWVKFLLGLALLPVCVATAKTVWQILATSGGADKVWLPMLAGAASWVVIFLLLPKPMWIYVLGHEMTHAVWTWICGGQVKRLKATSEGGHVVTTKSNFVIALAPYFFPFYAVVVVLVFLIGDLIWSWRSGYLPWFHFLLAAAYAFHITLTFEILKTRQSDITSQGYLFSTVVIFLGNAIVLILGVPLLTGHDLFHALGRWLTNNHDVFQRLVRLV